MPSTLSVLYSAFSCLTVALAASIPQKYDALVIGGGPAGLSALSSLSRVRRTAVMLDSGEYRNGPTREMHDVIGNDGTPPDKFRNLARQQILSQYHDTARIVDTTIVSVKALNGTNGTTSFIATDRNGTQYAGSKLILGTGVKDVLPNTPGLEGAFGKGVFWCPWCDGFEHRDQPFGLLCPLSKVVPNVREVATLNSDIIAFVNGTQTPENEQALDKADPQWREELAAYNVTVDNRIISSIERLQDGGNHTDNEGRQFDIFRLHFTDGSTAQRNAFLTSFPVVQRSNLAASLGAQIVDNKIQVSIGTQATNIPGVYAVGDANSDGSTNVPHAMFSAKRAVVYLHGKLHSQVPGYIVADLIILGALAREEMRAAISKRTVPTYAEIEKRMGNEMEDLWAQVNES
ncbi:hypothetical protein ASPWEDRAFT_115064 [Aspergillus wentii DTO 134E9]|uniref:FAD/NAD(P)-binding domain-containing protein n=1 Tax=Aspergillus wentii DTO 134E9 TaxID=1073089 RepID=A0A1L9RDT0_ASPWE|nr:uncharacterized protein ASPWEDRAFT_115064 [Aspergillus wentii DTO 134E9]OJJ33013.1 hypothetical protein ASPWEDRAFT_115064 [Aspergillus wentii DTO 134E9]